MNTTWPRGVTHWKTTYTLSQIKVSFHFLRYFLKNVPVRTQARSYIFTTSIYISRDGILPQTFYTVELVKVGVSLFLYVLLQYN